MALKLLNLNQKVLKFFHIHYAWKIFLENGQWIIWKNTGLNGYVYDFSVDYDAITVNDILDIL